MKHTYTTELLFLFYFLFFFSIADSQTRQYERKSVTSLGAVLFKTTPAPELVTLINNRLKAHLEVARFDYNALSGDAVNEFVRKANATDLSPNNIQRVLEETIVPQITLAVNAVAEERAKGNLTEEDIARTAVDKMKGSGLTAEDIKNVMNSAYLYLPVVTNWNSEDSSASMEGYVAWYRIKQNDGKATVEKLKEASTIQKGSGSGNPSESYRLKNRSVNGTEFAKIIAVNTWAKNLAVAMKNISAFQLGGEVKNVDGNFIEINLGKKEGVGLDDGYDVLEDVEDSKGNIVTKEIGFVRADKVSDNMTDNMQHSRFRKYIGGALERGLVIRERARLGIDITVRPKYFTANIPRFATPSINYTTFYAIFLGQVETPQDYDNEHGGHGFILKDDAKSGIGIDITFNLNIAKMTKVSQLFLNLDLFAGVPNAEVDDEAYFKSSASPILYSGYIGPMKKNWFGRMNFNVEGAIGVDVFSLFNSDAQSGEFEKMDFISPGIKLDAGIEYLINPDVTFNVGISYKAALSPIVAEVKFKDEKTLDISELLSTNPFFSGFNDLNMSGVSIFAGISYALPSLSVDPFAGLTAKDIDY